MPSFSIGCKEKFPMHLLYPLFFSNLDEVDLKTSFPFSRFANGSQFIALSFGVQGANSTTFVNKLEMKLFGTVFLVKSVTMTL